MCLVDVHNVTVATLFVSKANIVKTDKAILAPPKGFIATTEY